MKKSNNVIKMIFCGLLFCCISCDKNGESTPQLLLDEQNVAIPMEIPKTNGFYDNYYQLVIKVGHPADSCKGCVVILGKVQHIDCLGYGHYCSSSLFGSLVVGDIVLAKSGKKSESFSFEVDQTTHSALENITTNSFEMPARSLRFAEPFNEYNYMNIPAQWIERIDSTQKFLIEDIVLSNTPLYN